MKLNDVANRMRVLLPAFSTLFSDYLTANSISSDGATTTIVFSAPHDLTTGEYLSFNSIGFKNDITAVSSMGTIYTFTLANDSDITLNWYRDFLDITTLNQIELQGFTDANWNKDTHTLADVPNRRNFSIVNNLTAPILNGNEYILEIIAGGINTIHQITVVDTTTITIASIDIPAGTYEGGIISKMPRIGVVSSMEDFRDRVLTPKTDTQYSIGIAPGDTAISKDRATPGDAVSNQSSGTNFRLGVIDSFHVFIAAPKVNQLSGASALDTCRHTLRPAIYKCLAGANFSTGLSQDSSDYLTIPISDGVESYNNGILFYGYDFQFPYDMTSEDITPPDVNRAFRDIAYNEDLGDGVSGSVDLDTQQLT